MINEMVELIGASLYLFLPAYAANMAPVVAKRLRLLQFLARPLDGGRRLGAHPLLGPNKTLRGLLVGWIAAVGVAVLQALASHQSGFFETISSPPHMTIPPILWGSALGGGALLGDALKSFFKRRRGIPPGSRWLPWDQIDAAIGGIAGAAVLYPLPPSMAITIVISTFLLGLLVNRVAYLLSVKEAW